MDEELENLYLNSFRDFEDFVEQNGENFRNIHSLSDDQVLALAEEWVNRVSQGHRNFLEQYYEAPEDDYKWRNTHLHCRLSSHSARMPEYAGVLLSKIKSDNLFDRTAIVPLWREFLMPLGYGDIGESRKDHFDSLQEAYEAQGEELSKQLYEQECNAPPMVLRRDEIKENFASESEQLFAFAGLNPDHFQNIQSKAEKSYKPS